jgi:hypothetical protein
MELLIDYSEIKKKIRKIVFGSDTISVKMDKLHKICSDLYELHDPDPSMPDDLEDLMMIFIDDSVFEESERSRFSRIKSLVINF